MRNNETGKKNRKERNLGKNTHYVLVYTHSDLKKGI